MFACERVCVRVFRESSQEGGTKLFMFGTSPITWTRIVHAYERNREVGLSGAFRPCPDLTEEVVKVNNFSKMNVRLAKVIFSPRTRAFMETLGGKKQDLGTLKYLEACDGLFSVFLSSEPFRSVDDPRFTEVTRHMRFFERWHMYWESRTAAMEMSASESSHSFLSPQTWWNLRVLTGGWVGGVRDFLKKNPGCFFVPKRMTQSPLESVFSCVRQGCGGSRNPTMQMYTGQLAVKVMRNDEKYTSNALKTNYHDTDSAEYSTSFVPGDLVRRDYRTKVQKAPTPLPCPRQAPMAESLHAIEIKLSCGVYRLLRERYMLFSCHVPCILEYIGDNAWPTYTP